MLSAIAYVGDKATQASRPQNFSLLGLGLALVTRLRADRISGSERVAADLIEANGGRMTDALEREIGRRFQTGF